MKCAKCREFGVVGTSLFPYSIALGVWAWLHELCCSVAKDDEWRAEAVDRASTEPGSFDVRSER